jgi:hypothetical protein
LALDARSWHFILTVTVKSNLRRVLSVFRVAPATRQPFAGWEHEILLAEPLGGLFFLPCLDAAVNPFLPRVDQVVQIIDLNKVTRLGIFEQHREDPPGREQHLRMASKAFQSATSSEHI